MWSGIYTQGRIQGFSNRGRAKGHVRHENNYKDGVSREAPGIFISIILKQLWYRKIYKNIVDPNLEGRAPVTTLPPGSATVYQFPTSSFFNFFYSNQGGGGHGVLYT